MNFKNNISILFVFGSYFLVIQDSHGLHLLCKLSDTPINPDRIDIENIVSYIKSQEFDATLIDDVVVTETQIILDTLEYRNGLDDEDRYLPITKLIKKYGFAVEVHTVTTPDGYILTMYRIPGNGSSVFLMHGLLGSSDDYVTAGPDSALAYILARAGHDVWMGNGRGNKHSRKHVSISPECVDFWDFSWHEIGRIDLPTMIDFALAKTGKEKLSYVGYSQGTTTFFVMASELPEYNDKIAVMAAIAPIAFMSHLRSPLVRTLALGGAHIYSLLHMIGINEFLPNNLLTQALVDVLCGDNPPAKFLCSNSPALVVGFDRGQINMTILPTFGSHTPAGISTKQLLHYGQEITSAKFRQFDRGEDDNLKVYGSKQPPDYVLGNIRAPVALFYSDADWMSNVTDVFKLNNGLPNVVKTLLIPKYSHLDYVIGKKVKQLVYIPLLKLIEKYN